MSDLCKSSGVGESYGLTKRMEPVSNCRDLRKKDLKWNTLTPRIEIDPETYVVRANGVVLTCEPARVLPLAQKFFLF
ncbi:MAG: hypothetical protein HYR88_09545 [Verrucomicrobia bacterium]|nr:hypothetical protein [Verrucomicrobiota bacterium]